MNQEIYNHVKAYFTLGLDYGVEKNKLKKMGDGIYKTYFAPILLAEEIWIEQSNMAQLIKEIHNVEMVKLNYPRERSVVFKRGDLETINQQIDFLLNSNLSNLAEDLKDPQSLSIILELLHVIVKEELTLINAGLTEQAFAINPEEFIAKIEGIRSIAKIRSMLENEVLKAMVKQTGLYIEQKLDLANTIELKQYKMAMVKSYQAQLKNIQKVKTLPQLVQSRAPLERDAIKNFAAFSLELYIIERSGGLTKSQVRERMQVASEFNRKVFDKSVNNLFAVLSLYSSYVNNLHC